MPVIFVIWTQMYQEKISFIKLINFAAHDKDEKMKKPKLLSSNPLSISVVDFYIIAVLSAEVIPREAFHSFLHRQIIFINETIDFYFVSTVCQVLQEFI